MSTKEPKYLLGTDEKQAWMKKYFYAPKGYGFTEPGIVATDAKEMSAYNVAKSFYQIYPDVFNLPMVAKKLGISEKDVFERLKKMYEKRLFMFVFNPAVEVEGWGLWYWAVKLKPGTTKEQKEKLSKWFQSKDDICTGYEMEGDFDFFNGNHMRTLDNLLCDIIEPWRHNECVESVHLCPISRDVRESNVNQWDCYGDGYRKFVWGKGQIEKLCKKQKLMDKTDFAIIDCINNTKSVADFFNYQRLSELSGLDAEDMKKGMIEVVDNKRICIPMLYVNYRALGLSLKTYLVRMFQITPSYHRCEIVDELSDIPEFNNIFQFMDSQYDCLLTCFDELTDTDALRKKLESYAEIEEIKEAVSKKQFRRWTCRLDDENGFWEECVFTDDFLQDRSLNKKTVVDLDDKEGK